jgi:hypothetical protein
MFLSLRLLLHVPYFLYKPDLEYYQYGAYEQAAGNIFVMFIHKAVIHQQRANEYGNVVKNV